jgi:hypothetical protein
MSDDIKPNGCEGVAAAVSAARIDAPREKLGKKTITADAGGSRSPLRDDRKNVGGAGTCLASPEERPIHLGELGRWGALEKLEFVPARVEVRDFVARAFQLSFQIEDFRTRFRIKIGRGECRLQI